MPEKETRADDFADVPILVHVGPHKTGTGWLQDRLLAAARDIIYAPDLARSHQAFLHPRYGTFTAAAARAAYAPLLAQARAEKKPFVLSDEALGGWAFGHRFLREIAAERLASAFPHAQVLITTREQDAVLISMYSEYLRYGHASSLEAFLIQETGQPHMQAAVDLEYYDYDRTLDMYGAYFPADQVHAVPMEWGLSDPAHYPALLERLLGAPLGLPGTPEIGEVDRPSLSGWALAVLRRANMTRPQDTRYLYPKSRFSPNSLAFQADRFTPKAARARGNRRIRATVRRMLGDRFAASNARFGARTGYDLAALSYRLPPAGDG